MEINPAVLLGTQVGSSPGSRICCTGRLARGWLFDRIDEDVVRATRHDELPTQHSCKTANRQRPSRATTAFKAHHNVHMFFNRLADLQHGATTVLRGQQVCRRSSPNRREPPRTKVARWASVAPFARAKGAPPPSYGSGRQTDHVFLTLMALNTPPRPTNCNQLDGPLPRRLPASFRNLCGDDTAASPSLLAPPAGAADCANLLVTFMTRRGP